MEIPVIDLNKFNINIDSSDIKSETLKEISDKLINALFTVGFLYVTNHGVPRQLIGSYRDLGYHFFALSSDKKLKCVRKWQTTTCGFTPVSVESNSELSTELFDPSKPPDHKEIFESCHNCTFDNLPEEVEAMKETSRAIVEASQKLTLRIMHLLGHRLLPDRPSVFTEAFACFSQPNNHSALRFLHYPGVESENCVQSGQMRCGEHTDYGCLTLLYPVDTVRGLQVYTRKGTYIDVEPMADAILVNIGSLMQRWSGDQLLAAKHRVIFRPDTLTLDRYSLIYFAQPDDDVLVSPITSTTINKYPPVRSYDYLQGRIQESFRFGEQLYD